MNMQLPIQEPVLVFTIILLIILLAPILLRRINVPSIIGLIVAGVLIGPFGLNLVERNSAVVLFGTVGLLYIMFLAGLEIDMAEFKKNRNKSLVFGAYSFFIPMILGTIVFYYFLNYSIISSLLVASMFASHTLITYPLVNKLGIAKNQAVNITIGGTLIVNLAALLILAVIVGSTTGDLNMFFWAKLVISIIVFSLIVLLIFPLISRWFFKHESDSILQYTYVLSVVFVSSFLAILAGIEAIIGAFLAGFALNKLIARNSPLMNRIDFVGNTLFIPFFLIGVGMLVNYRVLLGDRLAILIAIIMSVLATVAKYAAAVLTQKSLKLSKDQMLLIFGLSNSQAASTLAAVLIGYNIIQGTTPDGLPIRLLDENILNGTILMILVTCTIASFATQKSGVAIAREKVNELPAASVPSGNYSLVGLANDATVESLLELALNTKDRKKSNELYGLHIITADKENAESEQYAGKLIDKAEKYAASADFKLHSIIRYDLNIASGIINTIKEKRIRHFFIGLHEKASLLDSFFGNLTNDLLQKNQSAIYIYKAYQPINTLQHFVLILPANAELENGFAEWYSKILQLAGNTGIKLSLYGTLESIAYLRAKKLSIQNMNFYELINYQHIIEIRPQIKPNTLFIAGMARRDGISYQASMANVGYFLSHECKQISFLLVYPYSGEKISDDISYNDISLQNNIQDIKGAIGKWLKS